MARQVFYVVVRYSVSNNPPFHQVEIEPPLFKQDHLLLPSVILDVEYVTIVVFPTKQLHQRHPGGYSTLSENTPFQHQDYASLTQSAIAVPRQTAPRYGLSKTSNEARTGKIWRKVPISGEETSIYK